MQLRQAIEAYLIHLSESNKKNRTIQAYRYDFDIVLAFFGAQRTVNEVTLSQVGKFLRSDELLLRQNGQPRCENMVNRIKRVFRMLLFWAYEQGHLDYLPIPKSLALGRNQMPEALVERLEGMEACA